VIHDIIAFDHEPHDRKAKIIERLLLPRVLRSAAHICTVSEATKEELLEKFTFVPEEKVTVVYAGPTAQKFEARSTKSETISNFGFGISDFPQRFILCVGTLCPRKNQLRLIEAYAKLRKDLKQSFKLLLVGGRGWDDEKIMQLATSTPGVEWLGYLPQREVTKLLQRATAFAYPSLKEGFGIPVLDAMAEGIPVLTSSGSSMKEIAGEAALLVNPESVEDIRNGLEQLLANENAREHLKHVGQQRASAFSWKRTVDLLLEACEKAVAVRSAH
jgi:alpha-1,3-rhamnosyl/mannosyltransferase